MRRSRGFSLLELTVAMALMLIALGIAYSLYYGVIKVYDMNATRSDAAREARVFVATMKVDIREASAIERADSRELILKTASIGPDGTPVGDSYDRITYALRGGRLVRSVQPASGSSRVRAMGRSCAAGSASFRRDGPRTVSALISSAVISHRRRISTVTFVRASLRN